MSRRDESAGADEGLSCPDAETLAAYLDGTLERQGRESVEAHAADCAECRSVLAETVHFQIGTSPPRAAVVVLPRGRTERRLFAALGALAAAAAVLLAAWVSLRPSSSADVQARRPELAELVAAVGDSRPFEPRLTGGFHHGPLQPVMRSGEPAGRQAPPDVRIAAARLDQVRRDRPSPESVAAFATAELVLGRASSAVALLEEVSRQRPESALVWSDLAAAYLVAAERAGDRDAADKALSAADRALALETQLPEALFNRALALEALGRADAARAAWRAYAALPARDAWGDEASRRAGGGVN